MSSATSCAHAQVSQPVIKPGITDISGPTPVYITDSTPGTTIVYTLDGSKPTANHGSTCAPSSTVPCFTLLGGVTVKAVAEDSSGNISTIFGHIYTAPASSNACTGFSSQDMYQANDFTTVQASITSNGATLGVDCNGGGYVNDLITGYGNYGNLIAYPYGRGFQTSIRDQLHSGFYNPTQAGIGDGDGTPITLTLTKSPSGTGGRINIAPYAEPLYLNPGFCFFPLGYYSPNDTNATSNCTSSQVTDGIWNQELSANISANQQMASEITYTGYYEDASNLGDNVASIFQYHFHMQYAHNPGAPGNPGATTWLSPQTTSNYSPIYKFGPAATYDKNGSTTNVLNSTYETASYDIPAYTDVANPNSLTSVQPTNTDLTIAQIAAGMRLQLAGGYTDYVTLNSTCDGWNAPQSLNITQSATSYTAGIYPAQSWPCGSVLAVEDPNDANAPMIAMYFPQTDIINSEQVQETNITDNQNIYLDRRVNSHVIAESHIDLNQDSLTKNGITYENSFTELLPVFRISGLLAPNHAGPNIDESVRSDIFVLVGSPAHLLTALQNMNANEGWNW